MPKIRSILATTVLTLTAALTVIAMESSAAAASGNTHRSAHRPGSTLTWRTSLARFTTDPGRMSRQPARGLDLRAPLSASFTSIEPGAPPSAPVGANPSGFAVNKTTHTVYVVNDGDNTVSVIDADACDAGHLPGCAHPLATISLGPVEPGPGAALLSPDGATLYVESPSGANSVAVIDAATCNATNTSGCAAGPVATVTTGKGPIGMAEDPASQTLYVANGPDNTVSVIDAAHCNAQQTAGCGETAPTVPVGTFPTAVAVNPETRTVYVANAGDNTVSVIDSAHCNAEQTDDCSTTPPVQAVPSGPDVIAVAARSDTVYVGGGHSVSVIDGARCNGAHPQGCSAALPPAVAVGSGTGDWQQGMVVDQQTQNVYLADSDDDTMSVIDGKRCNARHLAGCAQPAPSVQTGADPGAVAVGSSVHTIYVADFADNAVAVIDDRACTARNPVGCRPAAVPTAPLAPYHQLSFAAVDPAQHTAYVIDDGVSGTGPYALDLIDTSKCNAGDSAGCNPHPPLPAVALPGAPNDVAVDPSTDTLYVSEGGPAQLEVIAAASCNATVTSCAKKATIPFADADADVPGPVAVDSATHTVYVGTLANTAVIDARHCNAQDMTGCATQTPATIPVPFGGMAVAPDTLYSTGLESFTTPGWVSVIDTRHCQAADTSQCATQTNPPKVTVGLFPQDAAVDIAHHTLYVPDNANGNSPGQLSMIDTTHCNGDDTSDCASQIAATIPMPRAPFHQTFDPFTSTLYVTNFDNASVSVISTASCNATKLADCPHIPPQVVVGSGPWTPALDPDTHTLYVTNFFDGTVSIVGTGH